jgi:hypothetical protein
MKKIFISIFLWVCAWDIIAQSPPFNTYQAGADYALSRPRAWNYIY